MLKLSADPNAPPSPDSYSQIMITATPGSGAGSTAHSATTLVRVIENCVREFKTAYLDVRSDECMRSAGPDVLVATDQTVDVDGLALTPRTGTQRLVINKKDRIITSSVTDAIEVTLIDHPDIPLYIGDIDWDLGTPGSGPKQIFEYEGKNIGLLAKLPVQKVAVSLSRPARLQVNPTFKLEFGPSTRRLGLGGGRLHRRQRPRIELQPARNQSGQTRGRRESSSKTSRSNGKKAAPGPARRR